MGDMDMTKDYYQLLGVSPTATADELKQAHREAVLRHHPDIVGQSPKTLEYFRTIQDGYKILSTPELRREYDAVSGIAKTASAPSLVAEAEATAYHAVPKMHYEGSTFLRADKRWQMYVQKYKSENWKKIPLADRKIQRVMPLYSVPSFLTKSTFTRHFIVGGIALTMFALYAGDENRYAQQKFRAEQLILGIPNPGIRLGNKSTATL